MPAAPRPLDETRRLRDLRQYDVLDTGDHDTFDALTRLGATLADVPVAAISLTDETRQWLMSRLGVEAREMPRDWAPCGHVVFERRAIFCQDMRADARFCDSPLVTGPPFLRFYAGIPLTTPQGTVVGALALMDAAPRVLNEFQVEALTLLAGQSVAQFELRKSYEDLKLMRAREREFESRLQSEKIEEAQQLAAELHDGVGQELAGISMLLAASLRAPDTSVVALRLAVSETLPLLNNAIESCRRVAEGYGGFLVRNEGVIGALQRYTRRLPHPGMRFEFDGGVVPMECVSETEAHQLFGIAREAIANACRHSGGSVVRVRCEHAAASISLVVEDDGVGLADGASAGSGLGRSIMQYRAHSIGAQLRFVARPGGGLRVAEVLPAEVSDAHRVGTG